MKQCKNCELFDSYAKDPKCAGHWKSWGWCQKGQRSVFESALCNWEEKPMFYSQPVKQEDERGARS